MQVITIGNLKGGAGKTTTALHLAAASAGHGVRTVVLDLDPQQGAAKWGDERNSAKQGDSGSEDSPPIRPPVVKSAMSARLSQVLEEEERAGVQLVVIDTAAHTETILSPAIVAAHLVLIPCRTTAIDLQYLTATAELVASRRKPGAVLLNAVDMRTSELHEARAVVERLGIPLAPMHISNLVAHSRAITAGQGATEYEPNGKAAREIEAVYKWISTLIDLPTGRKVHKKKLAAA
jgi:chromosome partitioning protein